MFADKLFPSKIDLELNWITQQSKLKRKKKKERSHVSAVQRFTDDTTIYLEKMTEFLARMKFA